MKPSIDPAEALRELRALVATYLEGSDDAPRAAELLDNLQRHHEVGHLIAVARERVAFKLTVINEMKKRSVGIPYARQQQDPVTKTWFVACPICAARIDLVARKDFESFTTEEYQAHVAKEHPDA